jgi:DNA-binding transcriptional LysR family regulator
MFNRDCWWCYAAVSSLKALNRRYRVIFSSRSSAGVCAAVASGMAIGLLAEVAADDDVVKILDMDSNQRDKRTSQRWARWVVS